jgi:hypothetical protein
VFIEVSFGRVYLGCSSSKMHRIMENACINWMWQRGFKAKVVSFPVTKQTRGKNRERFAPFSKEKKVASKQFHQHFLPLC